MNHVGYVIDKFSGIFRRISNAYNPETETLIYLEIPEGFQNYKTLRYDNLTNMWIGELTPGYELNEIGIPVRKQEVIRAFEDKRIKEEADKIIEARYPPLKQRKMISIAIKLQRKMINGEALTPVEEDLLVECDNADIWITEIRDTENEAILNKQNLIDIVWPV